MFGDRESWRQRMERGSGSVRARVDVCVCACVRVMGIYVNRGSFEHICTLRRSHRGDVGLIKKG